MRKFFIFLVVVAVLGAGGWYAYQQYYLPAQAESQAPQYETLTVDRGNILSTVSASGNIDPEAEVSLVFRATGPVASVLVAEGDTVQEESTVGRAGHDRPDPGPRPVQGAAGDQRGAVAQAGGAARPHGCGCRTGRRRSRPGQRRLRRSCSGQRPGQLSAVARPARPTSSARSTSRSCARRKSA